MEPFACKFLGPLAPVHLYLFAQFSRCAGFYVAWTRPLNERMHYVSAEWSIVVSRRLRSPSFGMQSIKARV